MKAPDLSLKLFYCSSGLVRGVDDDNKVKYSYPCLIPKGAENTYLKQLCIYSSLKFFLSAAFYFKSEQKLIV